MTRCPATRFGVALAAACATLVAWAIVAPSANACWKRRARCCVEPAAPPGAAPSDAAHIPSPERRAARVTLAGYDRLENRPSPFRCGFCVWRWNDTNKKWEHRAGDHSCKKAGECAGAECAFDPNNLARPLKGDKHGRVLKVPCVYGLGMAAQHQAAQAAAGCQYCVFEFNADSGTWDVKEFNCSAMAEPPCLAICSSPIDPGSAGDWVLSMCQ